MANTEKAFIAELIKKTSSRALIWKEVRPSLCDRQYEATHEGLNLKLSERPFGFSTLHVYGPYWNSKHPLIGKLARKIRKQVGTPLSVINERKEKARRVVAVEHALGKVS